jgi:hypothetical protein
MKRSWFIDQHLAFSLPQVGQGTQGREVAGKMGRAGRAFSAGRKSMRD